MFGRPMTSSSELTKSEKAVLTLWGQPKRIGPGKWVLGQQASRDAELLADIFKASTPEATKQKEQK